MRLKHFAPFAIAAVLAAPAFSAEQPDIETNPNFVPDTGTINRGFDPPVPSTQEARPIPTAEETRAALKMPDSDQPSLGVAASDTNATPTTGAGTPNPATTGPIAATGQTMPAKFSTRNDILDRAPLMALALNLTDEERDRIFKAVMDEKTPAAPSADTLAPASQVGSDLALKDMHPLPQSLQGIQAAESLAYVKTKNKVFLVRPATRIVVDVIGS
jgi:hypothetical protein